MKKKEKEKKEREKLERFLKLKWECSKETKNPELAMLRLNQGWPDFYDRLPPHLKWPYGYINIGDFTKAIELYFISAIDNFKKLNNREPSLREFIKYFPKELIKMEDEGYCYIIAGFHNEYSRLKEGFKKLITDKREAQKKKAKMPIIKNNLDALEWYFKIYDFKKTKRTWKDVIELLKSDNKIWNKISKTKKGEDKDMADIVRELKRWNASAKRYIQNSEKGQFHSRKYKGG